MATRPKESKKAFITWLWAQQAQLVALAKDVARNDRDGYDIAMDALTEAAQKYGKTGKALNRGEALMRLRHRVHNLCTEYRAARDLLSAKRNGHSRTRGGRYLMERAYGKDAELAGDMVSSNDTIWAALRVPYLPIYSRVGPGPCNLCGQIVYWTELNWAASARAAAGTRWMRKWNISPAQLATRQYDAMHPTDARHICGKHDAVRPTMPPVIKPNPAQLAEIRRARAAINAQEKRFYTPKNTAADWNQYRSAEGRIADEELRKVFPRGFGVFKDAPESDY